MDRGTTLVHVKKRTQHLNGCHRFTVAMCLYQFTYLTFTTVRLSKKRTLIVHCMNNI